MDDLDGRERSSETRSVLPQSLEAAQRATYHQYLLRQADGAVILQTIQDIIHGILTQALDREGTPIAVQVILALEYQRLVNASRTVDEKIPMFNAEDTSISQLHITPRAINSKDRHRELRAYVEEHLSLFLLKIQNVCRPTQPHIAKVSLTEDVIEGMCMKDVKKTCEVLQTRLLDISKSRPFFASKVGKP